KFIWIVSSCMLLVGCSKYTVVTQETTIVEEVVLEEDRQKLEASAEENAYYKINHTLLEQTYATIKGLNGAPESRYKDEIDTSGYRVYLNWELFEEQNISPETSEWATKLDEVFPGIKAFMTQVGSETANWNPQSIVINNAMIKIKPAHLYEIKDYGYSYNDASYMTIENEPVILIDDYFKKLAEAIPTDKFVVNWPYVEGTTKLLRFTTPAFEHRDYMGLYLEEGKTKETYFEQNALGYQLFVEDNQLQKIRVVFNKINDEVIDRDYFDSLMTWCQNEWNMDEANLQEVEGLIDQVMEGKKGKHQGSFDDYTYTYHARNNPEFRYYHGVENEYQETEIEWVIARR
ncbi:MAG: hypothetical protein RSD98_11460, partial [Niameybacter sp.]